MAKKIPQDRIDYQGALKDICGRVLKKHKAQKMQWLNLLNDRIGLDIGTDYEKGLSRGAAAPEKADQIKAWLLENEPDLAYGLYPQYFPRSLRTQWQGLLEERGVYDHVHTQLFKAGQLHEIGVDHPINARIPLDQNFTIEVQHPIEGSVIALTRYRAKWYPLMLRAEKTFDPIPVTKGIHAFPIRGGDLSQIVPMRESSYGGEHRHCFIIAPHGLAAYYAERFIPQTEIPLTQLDAMAKRLMELESEKVAVLLENVIFE